MARTPHVVDDASPSLWTALGLESYAMCTSCGWRITQSGVGPSPTYLFKAFFAAAAPRAGRKFLDMDAPTARDGDVVNSMGIRMGELPAGAVARSVLRGPWDSNAPGLPDGAARDRILPIDATGRRLPDLVSDIRFIEVEGGPTTSARRTPMS